MRKQLTVIAVGLAFSTILCAQEPSYPHIREATIAASVSYESTEQMFYYKYAIISGDLNIGKIARFEIDISTDSNVIAIDTIGLRFEDDGYTEKIFRRDYSRLRGVIVPVGFLKTPPRLWSGALTVSRTARFSGVEDDDFVFPGDTLSGFEMMSKGLPGIRRCIVSPFFDVMALFPDPADTTITFYVPPVDSVRLAVKYHTATIGPTAPPTIFAPLTFLDTLISFKHQAFDLGWIKEEGIVTSLDAKLEAARVQIINDRPSAKQILQAFVNELEALNTQSNKITSEAYALLKFNAQYLISKL